MGDTGNVPSGRGHGGGWSFATVLGLLAVVFLVDRLAPAEKVVPSPKKEATHDAPAAGLTNEEKDRGRSATTPSEIPGRGWKDILLRVYANVSDHRILALAAGMTYYSLLAIFPALGCPGRYLRPLLGSRHNREYSGRCHRCGA
jgi:membrane protein